MDPDRLPIIHIYGQFSYHCEARIIANRTAMLALAEALTRAAEAGRVTMEAMAADGEGYGILIERTNSTGLNYSRLPYALEWGGKTSAEHHDQLRERIAELEALVPEHLRHYD